MKRFSHTQTGQKAFEYNKRFSRHIHLQLTTVFACECSLNFWTFQFSRAVCEALFERMFSNRANKGTLLAICFSFRGESSGSSKAA